MNTQRRKRLSLLARTLDTVIADLQREQEAELESYDNLPENMKGGGKADKILANIEYIEQSVDNVREAINYLREIEGV